MSTYYVDPAGNNGWNGLYPTYTGGSNGPWATLAYACAQVTTPYDIIHLNLGTYNETASGSLAVGVTLEGPTVDFTYPYFGVLPTAVVNYSGSGILVVGTTSGFTDGLDQEICNIRFATASTSVGIQSDRRHNVIFKNIHASGFSRSAIVVESQSVHIGDTPPATYVQGVRLTNSMVVNCGQSQGSWTSGMVAIDGTDGMEIDHNLIDNLTYSRNAICIKACTNDGHHKGLLIHDNTLKNMQNTGSGGGSWFVAIEGWFIKDESQIYDNRIYGEINIDTTSLDGGSYALAIHGNDWGYDSTQSSNYNRALSVDCSGAGSYITDIKIYENYIHHFSRFHVANVDKTMNNISVYKNVFYAMGCTDASPTRFWGENQHDYSGLYVWNNVFDVGGGTGGAAVTGIDVTGSNVEFINNVFRGFVGSAAPITFTGSGANNKIDHNMTYGNANNSFSLSGTYEQHGNFINVLPGFTGSGLKPTPYYTPSGAGSNLVDTGQDVGLLYSGSAPDIGRYEYTGESALNVNVQNTVIVSELLDPKIASYYIGFARIG